MDILTEVDMIKDEFDEGKITSSEAIEKLRYLVTDKNNDNDDNCGILKLHPYHFKWYEDNEEKSTLLCIPIPIFQLYKLLDEFKESHKNNPTLDDWLKFLNQKNIQTGTPEVSTIINLQKYQC